MWLKDITMKKNKGKISLVINTKNEEENLKNCIDSVKDIVDEIVVVDMQSADSTVKIAKKLGATVFSVPDYGYVEPARNFAFKKANYEWILLLDADERLNTSLKRLIRKLIAEDKYQIIDLPSKNIHFGKWVKNAGWWPDYKTRLFKKENIVWSSEIHSHPNKKGKIYQVPAKEENAIVHFNTKNVSQLAEKNNRYTIFSNSFRGTKEIGGAYVLAFIENEFWDRYIVKKGYKEGIHGYILSKFMEYYRFLEFAREWERRGYKGIKNTKEIYNILKNRNESSQLYIEQIKKLEKMLNEITSSKTFKVWQAFVGARKKLLRFFRILK